MAIDLERPAGQRSERPRPARPFLLPRSALVALFVIPAGLACLDYAVFSYYFADTFRTIGEIFLLVLVLTDREAPIKRRLGLLAGAAVLVVAWAMLGRIGDSGAGEGLERALKRVQHSSGMWLALATVWLAGPVVLDRHGRRYSRPFRYAVMSVALLDLAALASVVDAWHLKLSLRNFRSDLGIYAPLVIAWLRASHADGRLRRRTGRAVVVWMGVLIVGALAVTIAASLAGGGWMEWMHRQGMIYVQTDAARGVPRWRLTFPARYFNTTAQFFIIAIGALLLSTLGGAGGRRPSTARRLAGWGLAALAVYLIGVTGTRAALISLAVGMGAWSLLCSRRMAGLFALVLVGAVAALPAQRRNVVLSIFNPATYLGKDTGPTSMSLRYVGWRSGMLMIERSPLVGVGYGYENFTEAYPSFGAATGDVEVKRHLHNNFLQISAESGVPAGLLFLAWLIFRWQLIWGNFAGATDPAGRRRAAGWLALELALFTNGIVSYYLRRPFGLLNWGVWAYALGEAEAIGSSAGVAARTEEEKPPAPPDDAWAAYHRERTDWLASQASAEGPDDEGLTRLDPRWDTEKPLPGLHAATAVDRWVFNLLLRGATAIAARLERRNQRRAAWRRPPAADRPLHVMQVVGRVSMGGVAKVLFQTKLRMDPRRVRTTLVVYGLSSPAPAPAERTAGTVVVHQPLELWPPSWNFRIWRDLARLTRLLRRERPDLLHLHEPMGAPVARLAAALTGTPLLVQLHSAYTGRRGHYHAAHLRLEVEALRSAWLVGHTPEVVADARRMIGGEPRAGREIFLTEDGVDDQRLWRPDEALESWMLKTAGGRRIAMLVARLVPLKRIEDFLAAARQLIDEGQPIFPVMMLYGARRSRQRNFRRRLEGMFRPGEAECFQFVGSPRELMRHACVGVSCSEVEGQPKNILEFMSLGVPVVCSDIPAHRLLVEQGRTGLLFALGDVEGLAGALRRMLAEPALGERMAEQARVQIESMRWQRTADQVMAIYDKIAGRGD